eukprot:6199177-Pleurochrysis_carterae.AAC.1
MGISLPCARLSIGWPAIEQGRAKSGGARPFTAVLSVRAQPTTMAAPSLLRHHRLNGLRWCRFLRQETSR